MLPPWYYHGTIERSIAGLDQDSGDGRVAAIALQHQSH
jgi:hypothetical protein